MTDKQQKTKTRRNKHQQFVNALIANNFNAPLAAQIAGYKGTGHQLSVTANRLLTNVDINQQIETHKAKASEISQISLIQSQLLLWQIAQRTASSRPAAAVSAIATLLKTIPNAFKAEQPNPDNLRAKALSIQSIAELRKLAELQHKLQGRPVDSLPAEAGTEQTAEFVVTETPITPQRAGGIYTEDSLSQRG